MPSNKKVKEFQKTIWDFYKTHGRVLPWRETTDPYKILVSEVMLQQTQVSRVLPKYEAFLKKFPTVQTLAKATMQEVLTLWVGLGYNRRAKFLHQAAQKVVSEHGGTFPKTSKDLQELPGIGPYTASAVSTFAYNNREVLIETNLRTVYIHDFFTESNEVHDKDILKFIEQTLPANKKYKEWYWALMDYGNHLKEALPNPSRRSMHHTKQSKFKGSLREARGFIVRVLTAGGTSKVSLCDLAKQEGIDGERVIKAIAGLVKDNLIEEVQGKWQLK